MFACLYRPPHADDPSRAAGRLRARPADSDVVPAAGVAGAADDVLVSLAQEFSPRYERHRADLVSIDISGLRRVLGSPRTIGEELRRAAAAGGVRVHVAVAGTRMAALVLAIARPGLTVIESRAPATTPAGGSVRRRDAIESDDVAGALARLPIGVLEKVPAGDAAIESVVPALRLWGVKTLGELAMLPPADLASRLGRAGLMWQAVARGEDLRPLVPTLPDERFISSLDLEWPIEGLEPLSFVLTRLLEPLSTRLERRDRGAAALHIELGLVTHEVYVRRLQLPAPLRDVRALRTLALLDLDAHPPPGAIDRVTITIDPTPGRVLQHTLFTRARPTAEQLSTLLARLGALMGQDRIGAPAMVDSYRPGAFETRPFAIDEGDRHSSRQTRARPLRRHTSFPGVDSGAREKTDPPASGSQLLASGVRRCRQPVPARVAVEHDRPRRVTSDRRGFAGGQVLECAGPWRTSGEWWLQAPPQEHEPRGSHATQPWNRDEWDVSLDDGAVYRIFRDRETDRWFIDAIVD